VCPTFASAYYNGALLTRWPGSVVYFFFPETRGWSLEDMDAIFMMAKNSLEVPKAGRRMPQMSILVVSDHVPVPVQGGDKATEGGKEGEGEGEGKGTVVHMENA
jgi:hypothetical protein